MHSSGRKKLIEGRDLWKAKCLCLSLRMSSVMRVCVLSRGNKGYLNPCETNNLLWDKKLLMKTIWRWRWYFLNLWLEALKKTNKKNPRPKQLPLGICWWGYFQHTWHTGTCLRRWSKSSAYSQPSANITDGPSSAYWVDDILANNENMSEWKSIIVKIGRQREDKCNSGMFGLPELFFHVCSP